MCLIKIFFKQLRIEKMPKSCICCAETKQELLSIGTNNSVFCASCINLQKNSDEFTFSTEFQSAVKILLSQQQQKALLAMPLMRVLMHLADVIKTNQPDKILVEHQKLFKEICVLCCEFITDLTFKLATLEDRQRLTNIQQKWQEIDSNSALKENNTILEISTALTECNLLILGQLWGS